MATVPSSRLSNEEWSAATQASWSWLPHELGFAATFEQAGTERWVVFRKCR
jgi:hypothetical protein